MDRRYESGAHTKHRLLFHIVFIPKYRKRILRFDLAKEVKQLVRQGCEINEWTLHEIEVMPDHVHMLVQINPRNSIAEVMHRIKGGSSRVIRQKHPELEEFLWGDSLWSDGYFAESVGRISEKAIRKYIQEQQNKQVERTHGL